MLLDFGLIAREHNADTEAVGNVNYASPEQLEGAPPHRTADAYAFGVCLYRALTGRLPVALPMAGEAISLKRWAKLERPSVPDALAPLAAYCLRLLSPEPAGRPSLRELVPLLSGLRSETELPHRPSLEVLSEQHDTALFAGRGREICELQRAAERARSAFTLVLVEGDSGLGKSTLVAEFARSFEAASSHAWALSGRCYENEQLSLKAFDGSVDQLARKLRSLPALDLAEALPKKAALLAQLFPVLGSVSVIAEASKKGLPADPGERRTLALRVFAELLQCVARARPLLLVVDDLQWADHESLSMLHSLSARGTDLPMLVVATLRGAEGDPEVRAQIEHAKALPNTAMLSLERLDPDATAALARAMLGAEVAPRLLERLAQESGGNPLFLRELVAHTKEGNLSSGHAVPSLNEVISARVAQLEARARLLLRLVALAGRPYPVHVFAAAMEAAGATSCEGAGPLRESLDRLLMQGLLRRRSDTQVDCYHDRVREVALATVASSTRAEYCASLAKALDLLPMEAAQRARLWEEAGNSEKASTAHEAAADAAIEKLAFALAEMHYGRAQELAGEERDARWLRLTIQRAQTRVRMGNNAAAAHLFAAAADSAKGEQRIRLRIWAAQNLIQGAQVEEGLQAASELFRELGIPFAENDGAALRALAWEGLKLKWRGTALRQGGHTPAFERLALDALNELAQPVTLLQFLRGAALSAQHVRRALAAGEPAHAARALAYEATLRTTRKPLKDHSALFDRARELAESTGDPAVIASVQVRHGMACLGKTDYLGARDCLIAAHELISTQCPGQPWLLTTARMSLGCVLHLLGDHASLAAHSEAWILDAKLRGDAYAYASLSGYGFGAYRHLLRGDPDAALAELAEAMAPWPTEPVSIHHVGALWATLDAHLFRGGEAAWQHFQRHRAMFQTSALARSSTFRIPMIFWEVSSALALLSTGVRDDSKLVQHVLAQLRSLEKLPSPLAAAFAGLLSAELSAWQGRHEQAYAAVRAAREVLESLHHGLKTPALFLEGWLERGASGRAKCEEALAVKRAHGWTDPLRGIAVCLPIVDRLCNR